VPAGSALSLVRGAPILPARGAASRTLPAMRAQLRMAFLAVTVLFPLCACTTSLDGGMNTPCADGGTACIADTGARTCAVLSADRSNCGGCFNSCAAGEDCVGGDCLVRACHAPPIGASAWHCGLWLSAQGHASAAMYPDAMCRNALAPVTLLYDTASSDLARDCTHSLHFILAARHARIDYAPAVTACPASTTYRFEVVGRINQTQQRNLIVTARFGDQLDVSFVRWIWNGPREAGGDILFADLRTDMTESTRPWGGSIGSDSNWFRMTLDIDPGRDQVFVRLERPGMPTLEHTAMRAIPDGIVPAFRMESWGNCDASNRIPIDAEVLGVRFTPDVYAQ